MREIIEFITNNFFVVVVVVGFIFSLFSKMKKGDPNRRMPDFGGGGNAAPNRPRPAAAETPQREEQPRHERPVYTSTFEDDRADHWEYEYETPRADRLPAKPATVSSMPPAAASSVAGAREQGGRSLRLSDRDELARAVLMAEILGPPRAKKPFGRR
ncbi:hypothetical protein [Paenibacillus spongiae]|uniref:Uncharacterized protein n=1 Tax=Paenibacillus spongiae TaxID=2909671 RepID=A0ABY5SDU7_9BACL|nr:hypothetical protein [Paenibacillus spongiae]UVI32136.1 hypothetical protein L1F29_10100 [Paenibacillus spongiae]